MIFIEEAQEICESWTNGNRSDVRRVMKNKNKKFALDLAFYLGEQIDDYKEAMKQVYEMCDEV